MNQSPAHLPPGISPGGSRQRIAAKNQTKYMKSKYKMGWIGIRVGRLGGAGRLLRDSGWLRLDHSSPNNRDGFDWVLPCQTRSGFLAMDWRTLAGAGLEGMAFWVSSAQREADTGMTAAQWGERALIEMVWCDKYPRGLRVGSVSHEVTP